MFAYMSLIDSADDQTKFEKVYLKYKNLMFYVADQILNNPQDSEDAVHNAFVKIAENIHKVGDAESPKTKAFVSTIVENTAIDLYREKKRNDSVDYYKNSPDIFIDPESGTALALCMAKMPCRYREVLLLKYSYGFSNCEIAQWMDISEVNAIKLDQRAKQRLRELCTAEEVL